MVDLIPTAEQQQIVESVARFLGSEMPVQRLIRAHRDPALESARWTALAELSWLGICLPEDHGGAGLTLVEEMLVFREFGRVLAPPQVFGAALGARIAAGAGQHALSRSIISGTATVAASINLDSEHVILLDADAADLALIVQPSGAALVEIIALGDPKDARSFDESVALSRVAVGKIRPVCRIENTRWHCDAQVISAAYLAGIIDAVKAMATHYAATRHQFGQAIGAFQAVKHRCADNAIRAEAAMAQTAYAALAVRDDRPDAEFQARSAKIVAGSYAILSAQENIQLHGAIGTTIELPAHLYLKRAHLVDHCFGSARSQKHALLSTPNSEAA
jgi:alkylation response protein AidB-like acyl-CoA dehydrogenase